MRYLTTFLVLAATSQVQAWFMDPTIIRAIINHVEKKKTEPGYIHRLSRATYSIPDPGPLVAEDMRDLASKGRVLANPDPNSGQPAVVSIKAPGAPSNAAQDLNQVVVASLNPAATVSVVPVAPPAETLPTVSVAPVSVTPVAVNPTVVASESFSISIMSLVTLTFGTPSPGAPYSTIVVTDLSEASATATVGVGAGANVQSSVVPPSTLVPSYVPPPGAAYLGPDGKRKVTYREQQKIDKEVKHGQKKTAKAEKKAKKKAEKKRKKEAKKSKKGKKKGKGKGEKGDDYDDDD